jgi:hypothetical protein
VLGGGIATVRAVDADPRTAPQARQERLRSGISAEHDGHRGIETHSSTEAIPVGGLWTAQIPYHTLSSD